MQKSVDAVAIGAIALGVVVLIVLFVLSNNMMPQPLPAVQKPDLNATERTIQDPLGAAMAPQQGFQPSPGPGGPVGFGASSPGPVGGPAAPSGPPPGIGGGRGRGGMPEDY